MSQTRLQLDTIGSVKYICGILIVSMYVFLMCSFLLHSYHPNIQYPHATFLYVFKDRFMDFFNVNNFVYGLKPYVKDTSYPPFALMMAYPFSLFGNYPAGSVFVRDSFSGMASYVVCMGAFLSTLLYLLYASIRLCKCSKLSSLAMAFLLLNSYPLFFLLDRGNYIVFSVIFLALFAVTYQTNKKQAAFFLGAAIALKIYPIVFLILFLIEKKFKEILMTLVFAASLTWAALILFDGGMFNNIKHFFSSLLMFTFAKNENYPLTDIAFNSSLLGIFKIPTMLIFKNNAYEAIEKSFIPLYFIPTVLLVIAALKREIENWKKLLMLFFIIFLFSPFVFDYYLAYLYVPLIAFIRDKASIKTKEDFILITAIGLLLAPKAYKILFTDPTLYVTLQCILNPIIIFSALLFYVFCKFYHKGVSHD